MRRKLWITAMSLIALSASGRPARASAPDLCLTVGSLCSNGQECCSQKCDCASLDGCYCL